MSTNEKEIVILNFILTHETKPKILQLATYETITEIKDLLKQSLSCETLWTPQQLHYVIKLYNHQYNELDDKYTIRDLLDKNMLWTGDDIQIVINVNSGRLINYYDRVTKYLRNICIQTNYYEIREEPNHNYMFEWKAMADEVIDGNREKIVNVYEKNNEVEDPELGIYEYYGSGSNSSNEETLT